MSEDHDHAGDRLGEDAPVESLDVNSVSFHEFDLPGTYLVFPEGDRWIGYRTGSQEVEFTDDDCVNVINRALERLGELAPDAEQKGLVRVTADEADHAIKTTSTIRHTTDGTALSIEPHVFSFSEGDAILLAGDQIHLDFTVFEARSATYAIRDLGLSNSTVRGELLVHGTDAAEAGWYSDAANQTHPTPGEAGNTYVHIDWLNSPNGPAGIKMGSAPDARFENYRFRLPILFGGTTAVVFGDRNDADTVNNTFFAGDIDAASSDSRTLAELNDPHNGLYLKDYTPGSGEDDVIIRPSAADSFVLPLTVQGFPWSLHVRREALDATDLSKFDPFKAQVARFELLPESLSGYATTRRGTGDVRLQSGFVEQTTGAEADSWANVRRRVSANYARLSFSQHAVLQTNVHVGDNAGQQIWLLWGGREGPGVGWHVRDDRLLGFVHDGETEHTTTLRTGFDPGATWNLTALYNPSAGVQYYVQDTETAQTEALSGKRGLRVEADGTISASPTGERSLSFQVMAMELTNTTPEEKEIRWSTWRNHQYPISQ